MAKEKGGSGSMAAETSLHQRGMKTRSPQNPDASMKLGKASVNDNATRSETAPTPRTIGDGRCA
jgi:hypothetical protein